MKICFEFEVTPIEARRLLGLDSLAASMPKIDIWNSPDDASGPASLQSGADDNEITALERN